MHNQPPIMHASRSRRRIALPKSISKHKLKDATSIIFILTKMRSTFSFRSTSSIHPRTRSTSSKILTRSDSQLKAAFDRYNNADGRVDPSDLGILIRSLGGNPTESQVGEILRKEKLTAPFSYDRFVGLMAKYLREQAADRDLRRAFDVIDQDSDGFVAVSDLRQLLTTLGETLDPKEFDEWIREVGVGPDGRVRYEDVIAPLMAVA
ncbi:hypothetical protein Dimus_000413 [Dionaea muscipula]